MQPFDSIDEAFELIVDARGGGHVGETQPHARDFAGEELFAYPTPDALAALEEDGRVFITGTTLNGRFVIRACVNNHRKQEKDIDYLLETIREVARKVRNQSGMQ